MAKVIEFFVPSNFKPKAMKWVPPDGCGKVIPFAKEKICLKLPFHGAHGAMSCPDVWNRWCQKPPLVACASK
jgi:hypothetical protein